MTLEPERIVIAGAGVAGLEAALCLREELRDRATITLLSATPELVFRAVGLGEAFGLPRARRHALAPLARDLQAELLLDTLAAVDPAAGSVRLASGAALQYDRLVVAVGAAVPPLAFNEVAAEIQTGAIGSVTFAVPEAASWTLPAYELALMSAAWGAPHGVRVSVCSWEERPLGIFGAAASAVVAGALQRAGVRFGPAAAERVVLMPVPAGRPVAGLPADADGFVPVDPWGRVAGTEGVYAIGDCADHPVKQGGLAAQQACLAAAAIAHDAGAGGALRPPAPVLRGLLRTVDGPLYLRAALDDVEGTSTAAGEPLWWPPSKLASPRLTAHLSRLERARAEGFVLPSGGLALRA